MERPMGITKVLLDPWRNFGLEIVSPVHIFVDFHSLIQENQEMLPLPQISSQTMTG